MDTVAQTPADASAAGSRSSDFGVRVRRSAEYVVVHLFDPEMRSYYVLEDLWADAPRVEF